MRIIVRKSRDRKKLNGWLVFSLIVFIVLSLTVYFLLNNSEAQQQKINLSVLDAECSSYGQTLTNEFSMNSSACQQAALLNDSSALRICGSTFYCSYSYNCQNQATVQNNSGTTQTNTLSCLCDILKNTAVISPGLCFKQQLQ